MDTGIRDLLVSSNSLDLLRLIENVGYLELLRRGYKVSIGKLADKEVSFVASNSEGITYYQVSATVLDETTLARELVPLRKINDHHPKMLLTLDESGAGLNYDGIKQLNLLDWLLK